MINMMFRRRTLYSICNSEICGNYLKTRQLPTIRTVIKFI